MSYLLNKINNFYTTNIYLKTRVIGKSNIPKGQSAIYIANHTSEIDELLIKNSIEGSLTFVVNDPDRLNLKTNIGLKLLVAPENNDENNFQIFKESVLTDLKQGRSVCFFPEKKVTTNGYMGKFHDVISEIFDKKPIYPVVPIYLGPLWGTKYSEFTAPRISRPRLVNVTIGRPVDDTAPYSLREKVTELSAEAGMMNDYKEKTIQYRFMVNAKRKPLRKVLADYDGKELSNIQILVGALLLSSKFSKYETKNNNVGILLPSCNAASVAILAALYSGKVPCLLNFSLAKNVFQSCIKKTELDLIITSKLFVIKLDMEKTDNMIFLEDIAREITKKEKILTFVKALFIPSAVLIRMTRSNFKNLHNTAFMLFSSGSSGIPKAIKLSHHNMNSDVSSVINISTCDAGSDKITGNLPLFHSFGINICFWVPLMHGTKVVYIKSPIDNDSIVNAIKKHKLTILASTPSFLNNYIRKASREDFESLKIVILGAEKMNPMHVERFREKLGIEPIEGFGCTELSPIVSVNFGEDFRTVGQTIGKVGSIGKALPGIAAKIVDIDSFENLPPNQEGLLLVKGPTVMEGYYGDEKITQESIQDGWYNTQDMASIDEDGYITITGRLSRFSKIAGEMVSHEIIERMIRMCRGDVENSIVVTGAKDKKKGERIIVLYTGKEIHPHKINSYLSRNGMSNLWIPKANDYYHIDNIPLLGSGKLDLYKLSKIAENFGN